MGSETRKDWLLRCPIGKTTKLLKSVWLSGRGWKGQQVDVICGRDTRAWNEEDNIVQKDTMLFLVEIMGW